MGHDESEEDSEDDLEDIQDIRLGDVVISLHSKFTEAVVQYDFGKSEQSKEFIHIGGQLNKPPNIVLNAVAMLRGQQARKGHKIPELLSQVLTDNPSMADKFKHPGSANDRLFKSDVIHKEGKKSCKHCCGLNDINLVKRKDRPNSVLHIHYGTIGSADQVMKDATLRDKWARKEKIICFETEAAGLMDSFPCLVIRGICDYADSHKNNIWQPYAALTAASYSKELLLVIPGQGVRKLPRIEQFLGEIKTNVEKIKYMFDRKEDLDILNWLTPVNYGSDQSDNLRRGQEGTGQWLLDSTEYQTWLNADKETLFCPGIPGAGKTVLTAIVVNDLQNKFEGDTSVGLAYIYCNFRRRTEQKYEHFLAILLKQLIRGGCSMPDCVKSLYGKHSDKQTRPSFSELSQILHSVSAMYSRLFLIVDALDECQVFDGCQANLLSELLSLQTECGANIFVTSRYVPDVVKKFEANISVEIRARDHDVQRYLDGNLSQLPAFVTSSPELQDEIKTEIVRAVDGMFLLAYIHLNSLAEKTSPKSIRATLKALPTGTDAYDRAYKQALQRIEGQYKEHKELAMKVIFWITCTKRPLTTFELQHALAVEDGMSQIDRDNFSPIELIISVCAGLVTVDEASCIIRLVHYTTQEYMERTQKQWFPDAEADITKVCVTYLSFSVFESGFCQTREEFCDRLESNILFDYAAQNWGHHARMLSIEGDNFILEFLKNEAKVSACTQAMLASKMDYWNDTETHMTALHVAAHFGLGLLMAVLLDGEHNLDLRDVNDRTPLHYAAENGHQDVVKLLLDKGADSNIKDNYRSLTPLHYAVENGNWEVLKLLLEYGANPNIEGNGFYNQTPLYDAVEKDNQEMVKLLLDKGADPNIMGKSFFSRTALHYAVENGYLEMVKLLLNKGADPQIQDSYRGLTPLHCAAKKGHEEMVEMLLDAGANPNFKGHGFYTRTPLFHATVNGHRGVMKLLLENGANPNNDHEALLYRAVENRDQEMVNLLLDKGADPQIQDDFDCQTPLHFAVYNQDKEMVNLLIDKGVDPQVRDGYGGRTPLHLAVENRDKKMVNLLIDKGADPQVRDGFGGRTPLHYAVDGRDRKMVKLLLDKGADPRVQEKRRGETPLHYAVDAGDLKMVKMLLDRGADPVMKDMWRGRTSLHYAVDGRDRKMVKLLLDKGADPRVQEEDRGQTPLHLAVNTGDLKMVLMLLDRGADLGIKDRWSGLTPLQYATKRGDQKMVKLLRIKSVSLGTTTRTITRGYYPTVRI
ncbi:putative ankyrin repeat protein [Penicillium rolfsii]|nr:putative ankyrin repeat protein [Penicillium rolfsii]